MNSKLYITDAPMTSREVDQRHKTASECNQRRLALARWVLGHAVKVTHPDYNQTDYKPEPFVTVKVMSSGEVFAEYEKDYPSADLIARISLALIGAGADLSRFSVDLGEDDIARALMGDTSFPQSDGRIYARVSRRPSL